MISNSGHDENNNYYGGKSGDQTGGEWSIINWYSRPWDMVLRHPDEKVRKEIALLARLAANNNKIGYDQWERYTYWKALEKSNYDPSKITTDCEADCSAGVLANIKAVGYRLGIKELQEVDYTGYTGNMKRILTDVGFEVFKSSKYLNSDSYLLEGDILLNELRHTATNLDNGNKVTGNIIEQTGSIAEGQKWLNSNYGNLIKEITGSKLSVDNIYGSHSKWASLIVWKYMSNKYFFYSNLDFNNKVFDHDCLEAAKKMVIKKGIKGTLVYLAQFILTAKGFYNGSLDAVFGNDTKKAVIEFQNSKWLDDDGIIGKDTWSALFK